MRISAAQRIQNKNRIRAAMDRLLRGEITPGGGCDIKTLAREAGVDRTAFYRNRPRTTCGPSSSVLRSCRLGVYRPGAPRGSHLTEISCATPPFAGKAPESIAGLARWVTPVLAGQVQYREYTGQRLPHASWKGLSRVDPRLVRLPGTQTGSSGFRVH
jgi:hypothetical protein